MPVILVTGSTGTVGAWTVRHLAAMRGVRVRSMLAHGMPPAIANPLLELFTACKAGRHATEPRTFQELTGRAPRGFREFARDHARAWRVRTPSASLASEPTRGGEPWRGV